MSNVAIIKVNNHNYYVSVDQINNLEIIDNKLVNISNSNMTLNDHFKLYQETQQYPYISCNGLSACRLITSQNQWSYISSYNVVSKPLESTISSTILLLVIMGVCICQLLKH